MAERGWSGKGRSRRRGSRGRRMLTVAAAVVCVEFRDDDHERTLEVMVHLWWNSGLQEQRFLELVQEARATTKQRIAAGQVQLGDAGRRRAMPYFLAVLRDRAAVARILDRSSPPSSVQATVRRANEASRGTRQFRVLPIRLGEFQHPRNVADAR